MNISMSLFSLVFLGLPLSAISDPINLEDGLVAYYPLDGDFLDESDNSNDAIAVGALTFEPGIDGLAAKFVDGNYLNCGALFSVETGEVSVSIWVNFGQDNGDNQFFTNGLQAGDSHLIALTYNNNNNRKIRAVVQDLTPQNVYTPDTYPLNEWYHILFTRNKSRFQLFVNGSLVNDASISTGNIGGAEDWFFGRGHQFNGFFNGLLDEVRIYDRALNEAEIQFLYDPVQPLVTLQSVADSFVRSGHPNTNEGANHLMRIRASGRNRVMVMFDPTELGEGWPENLIRATLVLSIYGQASNNWGAGREVVAHRLLVPWAEGNGFNALMGLGNCTNKNRGEGPGVTWNCAEDPDVANMNPDGCADWGGGLNSFADATSAPVLHTSGKTGEVAWDVTQDVIDGPTFGWIVRKLVEGQSGQVKYYSREGALAEGNPDLAPRLILEFD